MLLLLIQDVAHPGEGPYVRRPRQRLGRRQLMAGSEMSINGRIWVSTEGRFAADSRKLSKRCWRSPTANEASDARAIRRASCQLSQQRADKTTEGNDVGSEKSSYWRMSRSYSGAVRHRQVHLFRVEPSTRCRRATADGEIEKGNRAPLDHPALELHRVTEARSAVATSQRLLRVARLVPLDARREHLP